MGNKSLMENIPAQPETSHDVSHTCSRMSVIWNKRQHETTKTVNLLSDEHKCHCATQRVPENVLVILFSSYCVRAEKRTMAFNTNWFITTGHYQDSHYHFKRGKLWSALLMKLNVFFLSGLLPLLLLLLLIQKAEDRHDYAGELRSCTGSDWVAAEKKKKKAFSVLLHS